MPRFLEHVSAEFKNELHGDTCKAIIETLLFHGRLHMGQLPHALRSLRDKAAAGDDGMPQVETADHPKAILKAVQTLVKARYIERVPPCTLPPPPTYVHKKAQKKKAAPKAGSEEEIMQQWEADKQQRRFAFQQTRFDCRNQATLAVFEAAEKEEDQTAQDGGKAAGQSKKRDAPGDRSQRHMPGSKRSRGEHGAVKVEEDVAEENGLPQLFLWRVNYQELNRRLRDKEIVELARQQYGSDACLAVEALLAETVFPEGQECGEDTDGPPVQLDSIEARSKRLHGSNALSKSRIRAILK